MFVPFVLLWSSGCSRANAAAVSVLQATLLQSKLNQIFEITIR